MVGIVFFWDSLFVLALKDLIEAEILEHIWSVELGVDALDFVVLLGIYCSLVTGFCTREQGLRSGFPKEEEEDIHRESILLGEGDVFMSVSILH